VFLLGNHPLVRSGLRLLLEKQPGISIVGEDSNQPDLVDCAPESPDIVLIDLDSFDVTALDLLPKLLSRTTSSRTLILTSSHDPEIHQRLVRLGAMGVVLKELPVEMLIVAIEMVNAGEIWIDRSMMAGVLRAISPAKGAREQDGEAQKIAALTKREREIVALFGEGLNNRRVAERLFISETTVRHHLTAIFDKLDVPDRFELVFYAYRHGLAKPPC
jgi:DNA-binding NarL/FixJ family response regulator